MDDFKTQDVRDLIVRGSAAARDGDHEMARWYLERALRQGPNLAQRAEAWWWLSQATDDPKEKRVYLENVLACDQADARARRALAILDGRLNPEEIIDPRRVDGPLPAAAPARTERFTCPACGGKAAFDPARGALVCTFCGRVSEAGAASQRDEPGKPAAATAQRDFGATLPTARAHGWEPPSGGALRCQGCGATFTLPPSHVSGACPFCASAYVVETEVARDLIEPEVVAPFQTDAAQALVHAHRWLESQRFRPGDLAAKAMLAPPRPVYLPFWTFDLTGEVRRRARERDDEDRLSPMANRTIAFPVLVADLLVPASPSLMPELAGAFADYSPRWLVPYAAELLADWPTEIYRVSLADASLQARQRAVQKALAAPNLAPDEPSVEGYEGVDTSGVVVLSYKLVLLPVWITDYGYRGKRYPLVVNGYTGRAEGAVPRRAWQRLVSGFFGNGR